MLKLENKTNVKTLVDYETNKSIPASTLTTVATITIPEDCYADIHGRVGLTNENSTNYKGISIYLNGNYLTNKGKGGIGAKTFESISLTKQFKKGDVIDLRTSQYTGASRNLEWGHLQIYYMPLTEPEVEEKPDSRTLKERINELQTKVATLENKTTMKTLFKSIENVIVPSGKSVKLMEVTIPEDCYADIFTYYGITNNNSSSYKGIWVYKNGDFLCGNGKGGTGGTTTNDESCMKELKKGDVLTLYCDQYTGANQTIKSAAIVINYFPK